MTKTAQHPAHEIDYALDGLAPQARTNWHAIVGFAFWWTVTAVLWFTYPYTPTNELNWRLLGSVHAIVAAAAIAGFHQKQPRPSRKAKK